VSESRPDVAWRVGIAGRDRDEIVAAAEVRHESPKDGSPGRVVLRSASGDVMFDAPAQHVLYVRRQQSHPALELPKLTEPKLRALLREVMLACLDEDAQKPAPVLRKEEWP